MTLRAGLRVLVLLTLVAAAGLTACWASRNRDADTSRLSWVATAHQFGPVGYRDPAGAVSSDGHWMAYSEGRFLRVRAVDGGPAVDFPPGEAQIRNIVWSPDNHTILADGHTTQTGWAAYDRLSGSRRGLWDSQDRLPDLRQLAWSPDGQSIAAVVNGDELQNPCRRRGALVRAQKIAHRIAFPAWTPARRDRVCRDRRRPIAGDDSVRRRGRSGPIRTSTSTARSRSRPTADDVRLVCQRLGHVDLWAAPSAAAGRGD